MTEHNDEYPKMIETETSGEFSMVSNPKQELDTTLKSLGRITDQLKQDPIFAALMNQPEDIEELRRASFQAMLDGRKDEARAMIAIIYRHDMQTLMNALNENGEQMEEESDD